MYENYREMSADEQAQVKAVHKAVRKETPSRYGNLAWAFVRGFPYRRVERQTRTQTMGDGTVIHHNLPEARILTGVLTKYLRCSEVVGVEAWLKNPDGAIPAPAPRPKKPFVRAEVA
jgi:hypothetical protein